LFALLVLGLPSRRRAEPAVLLAVTAYTCRDHHHTTATIQIALADRPDDQTVQALAAGIEQALPVEVFGAAARAGRASAADLGIDLRLTNPSSTLQEVSCIPPHPHRRPIRVPWRGRSARAALTAAPAVHDLLAAHGVEDAAAQLTAREVAVDAPAKRAVFSPPTRKTRPRPGLPG
jgi:hypothetical protein